MRRSPTCASRWSRPTCRSASAASRCSCTFGTQAKKPVEATNLYLDVASLDADATFKNIDIGVAAGDPSNKTGIEHGTEKAVNPNGFAQRADEATLEHVKQTAWATTAYTFKLSNLSLRLKSGVKECY